MSERLRVALKKRVTDPVVWLALAMIGIFTATAIWGFSPFPFMSVLGFVGALAEWITLARWSRSRRGRPAGAWLPLRPAADRWKILVLILISLLSLALELWVDSKQGPALWSVGLTLFGVSTPLFLWFAWSRPVAVDGDGLVLGASLVPWADVAGLDLESGPRNRVQFMFARPQHIFGDGVSLWLDGSEMTRLSRFLPLHLRSILDASAPAQRDADAGEAVLAHVSPPRT